MKLNYMAEKNQGFQEKTRKISQKLKELAQNWRISQYRVGANAPEACYLDIDC